MFRQQRIRKKVIAPLPAVISALLLVWVAVRLVSFLICLKTSQSKHQ